MCNKTVFIFQNIFILRMLLLSESGPCEWFRIDQLMDHKAERIKGTKLHTLTNISKWRIRGVVETR